MLVARCPTLMVWPSDRAEGMEGACAARSRLLTAVMATLSGHQHVIAAETAALDEAVAGDGLDDSDDFSDW